MPLFPNQSVWVSRYFSGKNFIAQSWVIRTSLKFNSCSTSMRHLSCWRTRSWWAFQVWMACTACWQEYIISSRSSSDRLLVLCLTEASMLERTESSPSQEEQDWSWAWSHVPWKWSSLGSLSAYTAQWSATRDPCVIWTCLKREVISKAKEKKNFFW